MVCYACGGVLLCVLQDLRQLGTSCSEPSPPPILTAARHPSTTARCFTITACPTSLTSRCRARSPIRLRSEPYGKPVVWDEVQYEGNITSGWGALSGEEETDRFFWGASLGVHVGHSETVLRHNVAVDDDQPLWYGFLNVFFALFLH